MWNYINDEDLAAELGCDPDDFYEEFHRSFQLYVWCGLIKVLSPRPGETQLRYRLIPRGMKGAGKELLFVDKPYLEELGAFNGAAWTAPEYADLEWAAEMLRSEAVLYLRRRRDDRRQARKAALNAGVKTSDVRRGESHRGGTAGNDADVGGNHIRSLRLATTKGHKNAVILRDRATKKMTPADIAKAQKLTPEWRAKHRTGSDTLMKRTLAAVCLCLLLATPAWAGFNEGVAAYDRKDYKTALPEWLPLTEPGDASAQYNLGNMHRLGQGVLKDYVEAARWFRRADEQGGALAHFNLGLMYYRGQGVSQNNTEAVSWFRRAAEQGDAPAQTYLGLMYVLGWGVRQDDLQAHKWWSLAATKGNKQAQKNLENITKTITPAQLAEAQKLAREWIEAFNKRRDK